jgi:hypothetical protein
VAVLSNLMLEGLARFFKLRWGVGARGADCLPSRRSRRIETCAKDLISESVMKAGVASEGLTVLSGSLPSSSLVPLPCLSHLPWTYAAGTVMLLCVLVEFGPPPVWSLRSVCFISIGKYKY